MVSILTGILPVVLSTCSGLVFALLLFRRLLERELESVGIRLNKRPPEIYFKVSDCHHLIIVTIILKTSPSAGKLPDPFIL